MATPRSYADKDDDRYMPVVHKDLRESPRAYTPGDGETEGRQGALAIDSKGGDWSWKPWRDKKIAEDFVTFSGVSPGAAEIIASFRLRDRGIPLPVNAPIEYASEVDITLPWYGQLSALFTPTFKGEPSFIKSECSPTKVAVTGSWVPPDVTYSSADSYGEFCPE